VPRENSYQTGLIKRIKRRFPGCFVLKNDANYMQGIPDLLVLWNERWAMLESKRSANEVYQPNQEHYLEELNNMSFAAMICPENEEVVLDELARTWELRW